MPTLSRLVYKPPKSYNEITTKQNAFTEVISMNNIFSILKNDFEILESQSAFIENHNGTAKLYFPKNNVTVTFEEQFDFNQSSLSRFIKELSIEYIFSNVESYLDAILVEIAQLTNQNLYFSFNLEKDSKSGLILIKGYLAKKIN